MKSWGPFLAAFPCFALPALGQVTPDTLASRQLQEIVVTATRNERLMGALPMPVSMVSKLQIRTMGSVRLQDALAEQTGLVVVPRVNGQGNGIQVQGFDPDYTLILVDGEPLVGRTTGSLELSRVTVGNIRQIEIVKGPSSSLYGSEALAGVINIITDKPKGIGCHSSLRYGTNNTMDLSASGSLSIGRLGVYIFGNRYSTNGYDLSPGDNGNTISPFRNYTLNAKTTYSFSPRTDFSLSGRFFNEEQNSKNEVIISTNEITSSTGLGHVNDWNLNPVLTHRFSDRFKAVARLYSTRYQTETNMNLDSDGSLYYHDDFLQTFLRPELNTEYFIRNNNAVTLGAGGIWEEVRTSRYSDEDIRKQQTSYAFFQVELSPAQKWNIIGGGRYDHNSVFGSQFSPKLSAHYEWTDRVSLKASGGFGFKAPDFRQLYLNFNNTAGGGYSVLGTEVVRQRLDELEAQGQIQTYFYDAAKIGQLQAEKSVAFNLGGKVKLGSSASFDFNGFYNSINNLIETQVVAVTNSNQSIYSYRNIKRALTTGVESNFNYSLLKNWNVSAGYQLLFANDKDVMKAVRAGDVYYRNPSTLVTKRLAKGEYFGLYNRSRHTANFKIFYTHPVSKWEGSLRVIYRGKFGIGDIRGDETTPGSDVNSNSILDKYDHFVSGYAMINLSAAKTLEQGVRFQVGVDNLFGYKNSLYMPNIPGRLFYASVGYSFFRNRVKPN